MCSADYLLWPQKGRRRWHRRLTSVLLLLLALCGPVRTSQDTTQNEIFTQDEKPVSALSNLSDLEVVVGEMAFTWDEYAADIPENSVGRVYVTPRDSARHRMGIQLKNDTLGKQARIILLRLSVDPEFFSLLVC